MEKRGDEGAVQREKVRVNVRVMAQQLSREAMFSVNH
jgi:hypothetical protein